MTKCATGPVVACFTKVWNENVSTTSLTPSTPWSHASSPRFHTSCDSFIKSNNPPRRIKLTEKDSLKVELAKFLWIFDIVSTPYFDATDVYALFTKSAKKKVSTKCFITKGEGEGGSTAFWTMLKQGQIGLERSATWFRFTVPGGQRVGLQGPRGSRGRPTGSQGAKG